MGCWVSKSVIDQEKNVIDDNKYLLVPLCCKECLDIKCHYCLNDKNCHQCLGTGKLLCSNCVRNIIYR